MPIEPIEWLGDRVRILDQTKLPQEEVYLELGRHQDIASAITELEIRGAPAIGVAGAYAVALGALKIKAASKSDFLIKLRAISLSLIPSKKERTDLAFADGIMVSAMPKSNAKKMI